MGSSSTHPTSDVKETSFPYQAPELKDAPGCYIFMSDMWSFGCLLYFLLTGDETYPDASSTSDAYAVSVRSSVDGYSELPLAAKDFIKGFLSTDPALRMTAQALTNGWLLK